MPKIFYREICVDEIMEENLFFCKQMLKKIYLFQRRLIIWTSKFVLRSGSNIFKNILELNWFKGSPPILNFLRNVIFSAQILILLVLLIIFGPYIMALTSRDHREIGAWTWSKSTLRRNFENFWFFKVVVWGRLIAQNDRLVMLIIKKI